MTAPPSANPEGHPAKYGTPQDPTDIPGKTCKCTAGLLSLAILRPFLAVGSANLPPISLAVRMCVPATKWRAPPPHSENIQRRDFCLPQPLSEFCRVPRPAWTACPRGVYATLTHVVHNGRVSQPVVCGLCCVCCVCYATARDALRRRCGVPLIVPGVARLGTRACTFVLHSPCERGCFARSAAPIVPGGSRTRETVHRRDLCSASWFPGNRTWRAAVQSANTQALPCRGP